MLPYTNRARSRDSRENMELERSCTYDLLSVVVHVGGLDTGHYTSYCRVGDQVSYPRRYEYPCSTVTDMRVLVVQIQRPQGRNGEYLRSSRCPGISLVLHHQIPRLAGCE
jgi:hypothetical protein